MKRKLCMAGFIGSENLGDEAIFISLSNRFNDESFQVTVLTMNVEKTRTMLGPGASSMIIRKKGLISTITNIRSCDGLVIGGGGLLQDQTSVFNIPYYLSKAYVALLLRKKVFFSGISVGPLRYPLSKTLLRVILNRCDAVVVRDSGSEKLLRAVGVRASLLTVSADPVLQLEPAGELDVMSFLQARGVDPSKPIMVVCLRHWFDTHPLLPVGIVKKLGYRSRDDARRNDEFKENIAEVLRRCLAEIGYQVIFLPFWFSRDSSIHRDIAEKLNDREHVFCIDEEIRPELAFGVIGLAGLVLGMRLHSIVMAAALGRHFVAVDYSDKVRNFLRTLVPDSEIQNISIDPSSFTADELLQKIYMAREKRVAQADAVNIQRAREAFNVSVVKEAFS